MRLDSLEHSTAVSGTSMSRTNFVSEDHELRQNQALLVGFQRNLAGHCGKQDHWQDGLSVRAPVRTFMFVQHPPPQLPCLNLSVENHPRADSVPPPKKARLCDPSHQPLHSLLPSTSARCRTKGTSRFHSRTAALKVSAGLLLCLAKQGLPSVRPACRPSAPSVAAGAALRKGCLGSGKMKKESPC